MSRRKSRRGRKRRRSDFGALAAHPRTLDEALFLYTRNTVTPDTAAQFCVWLDAAIQKERSDPMSHPIEFVGERSIVRDVIKGMRPIVQERKVRGASPPDGTALNRDPKLALLLFYIRSNRLFADILDELVDPDEPIGHLDANLAELSDFQLVGRFDSATERGLERTALKILSYMRVRFARDDDEASLSDWLALREAECDQRAGDHKSAIRLAAEVPEDGKTYRSAQWVIAVSASMTGNSTALTDAIFALGGPESIPSPRLLQLCGYLIESTALGDEDMDIKNRALIRVLTPYLKRPEIPEPGYRPWLIDHMRLMKRIYAGMDGLVLRHELSPEGSLISLSKDGPSQSAAEGVPQSQDAHNLARLAEYLYLVQNLFCEEPLVDDGSVGGFLGDQLRTMTHDEINRWVSSGGVNLLDREHAALLIHQIYEARPGSLDLDLLLAFVKFYEEFQLVLEMFTENELREELTGPRAWQWSSIQDLGYCAARAYIERDTGPPDWLIEWLSENSVAVPEQMLSDSIAQLCRTAMGRHSYEMSSRQLRVIEREEELVWADCGLVSLGFIRVLEVELNERLFLPACELIDEDELLALLNELPESRARGWRRLVSQIALRHQLSNGFELGTCHYWLNRVSRTRRLPDRELHEALLRPLREQLTEVGQTALSEGDLAKIISDEVRDRFRNPPAHTRFLPLDVAKECREHVEHSLSSLQRWLKS